MYLRFIANGRARELGATEGLFIAAYKLRESGQLEPYEEEWLEENLAWFRKHLKVPMRLRDAGNQRALCWFKANAKKHLERVWDLVALLKEKGHVIDLIKSDSPGIIVYEDGFQIAAKPFRKNRQYYKEAVKSGAYNEKQLRIKRCT